MGSGFEEGREDEAEGKGERQETWPKDQWNGAEEAGEEDGEADSEDAGGDTEEEEVVEADYEIVD